MKFEEVSSPVVITIELSVEDAPLLYWSEARKNWSLELSHASRYGSLDEAQAVADDLDPRFPEGVSGVVRLQVLNELAGSETGK